MFIVLSHKLAVQISSSYVAPFLSITVNKLSKSQAHVIYRRSKAFYCLDSKWLYTFLYLFCNLCGGDFFHEIHDRCWEM